MIGSRSRAVLSKEGISFIDTSIKALPQVTCQVGRLRLAGDSLIGRSGMEVRRHEIRPGAPSNSTHDGPYP
jgi:hypothetical protein